MPVLVARQPVFSAHGELWGYELLFRSGGNGCTDAGANVAPSGGDAATSTVIVDGFELVRPVLQAGQRVLINFDTALLLNDIAMVLPPEICVVEILEHVQPTRDIIEAVHRLKAQGYLVALDDYIGDAHATAFLPLADIVKVEVLGRSEADIMRDVAMLRRYRCQLLAEKVEDHAMHGLCKVLGFDLYQGFFFSKPELVKGKTLSVGQAVKMRLLSELSREDFELRKAADTIRADVALSFRLLRYINSVHFGLAVKVTSLENAVALLGTRKLVQWLCVTVLATMETTPVSRELVVTSALRGKFLEQLRIRAPRGPAAQTLFLAGLFSLLDALFAVSAESLLQSMPLADELVQVLTDGTGPLAPWLAFVHAHERGDWEAVEQLGVILGLDADAIARSYAEALQWTGAFHGS